MFAMLTLCAALLAGPTTPTQTAPTDTTRQFQGYANLPFAWGTVMMRKGKVIRAYLPTATTRGLEMIVPYYPQAPGPGKLPNPKLLTAANVLWMRVGGQYWELLRNNRNDAGNLAQRRQAGTIDLFLVQASATPILTALEPNPVLSSPVGSSRPELAASPASWYLRRAAGPPVLVAPANFATQVGAFLHDDPELARRVAAGQVGYRYEELESIIQQYNQHTHR
jgi:hypothetical protein